MCGVAAVKTYIYIPLYFNGSTVIDSELPQFQWSMCKYTDKLSQENPLISIDVTKIKQINQTSLHVFWIAKCFLVFCKSN